MKVLITTDQFTYNIGGVTTVVLALSEGLRKLGHEAKILTVSANNKSYRQGEVYYIRSMPYFLYPGIRMSFSMHDPLLEELTEWKPDVIHVHSELSTFYMAKRIRKSSGAAFILTCHTDYAHFAFGSLRHFAPVCLLMRLVGTPVYSKADVVTVPSKKALGFPHLSGVRDKLVVIPNGIELAKMQRNLTAEECSSLRQSLGIGSDDRLLVNITRISREKSISEIVSCFPALLEKLPDAKLLIVGDGPDRKHIERIVTKLGLEKSVILSGRVPHADVWKYYAIADAYVSASTFEVHSMAYLEAMAQGLPLICRRDDALDGVLEHGRNGLIYDTPEQLTEYEYKLMTDDKLRQEMAAYSLQLISRFSNDAYAKAMLDLYKSQISKRKNKVYKPFFGMEAQSKRIN